MMSSTKIGVVPTLVLSFMMCINAVRNLEYDMLEDLGMSCFPMDSCNRNERLEFENRNCECDDACHTYDDCCIDAPRNHPTTSNTDSRNTDNMECLAFDSDVGVYAISKCAPDYQGPSAIISKCETIEDIRDPLTAAPATDIAHNTTYKNHYCALCNNAESNNLRSWDINITCKISPTNDSSYVKEHLTFIDSAPQSWGFYYPEDPQSAMRKFYECDLPFLLPESLNGFVRFCRANLTSICAHNWTRNIVRENCKAYTAVVYIRNEVYKNPHCFVCNFGRNADNNVCSTPGLSIAEREKKPALSFTLLMDVNMSDGTRVGVSDNRCPSNKSWDPFAKRCRTLLCVPGYRIRGGECVRP